MPRLILVLTSLFILLSGAAIFSAVPSQMTVQGKLTDAGGNPLPAGQKTFTFRIFDAQNGGNEIWPSGAGETQFITTDAEGLWTANVGAVTPLTTAVFALTPRWLQITVNDGQALTTLPRIQLVASPYAQRVATVDGASGGKITGGLDLMPYAPSTLANNASGIRFWDGSNIQTAYGFVRSQGLWFQGSWNGLDGSFGVRAPTINGSLGPVVFSVDGGGSLTASGSIYVDEGIHGGYLALVGGMVASSASLDGGLTAGGNVCAANISCPSDGRLKAKIETLSHALDDVARLRGVRYEWRRDEFPERKFAEGQQVGLIAQEVQEVVPQAVQEMDDGFLAVDYARLVPLLIEGMKEQQKQIDELKQTIKSMTP